MGAAGRPVVQGVSGGGSVTLFKIFCDCGKEFALGVQDLETETEDEVLVSANSGSDLFEVPELNEQILPNLPDVEWIDSVRVRTIGFRQWQDSLREKQ